MRTRSHAPDANPENGEDATERVDEPTQGESEECTGVEVHLLKAVNGVRNMRRELEELRRRNGELEQRLEAFEQAEDVSIQPKRGKRGGPTVAKLQSEARRLNGQIRDLEKARRKDRKKIAKLRAREVKEDVAELEDDAEIFIGDSPHRMRKLLRSFHDIVLSSSIEENEECPICMDPLEVDKSVSLPCEHTFCKSCISKVSPGEEDVICPQCRTVCPRDEIDIVQYTASQQWDDLLEVAKAWAKMDLRRQADTSEEEAEEEFIDDELPNGDASSVRSGSENPIATSPEPEEPVDAGPLPSTPPPDDGPPATPVSRKRRITFTPESSPLSQVDSVEPEDPGPSSSLLITELPEPSVLPAPTQDEPVAGPSSAAEQSVITPQTSQSARPAYVASPTRDKRKRMEDLAAARKQKRRL
ncbi:uncharacterized protein C8Q71DRAFT_772431 [Rhodofomes roseus]|uniref:RING-type domain-containing protein n=1 Tax=Rhodofomes roseus TaxID=34475 RepID=A0ABQ8K8W6_9APHY|nr:uncharacterized protein C8Q71DRAFT_772431 [Rhodofomes roseus]KAH9833761.1 hypothetical protein C8Q71DRAFT_772431 [Rhodofomes roseus]